METPTKRIIISGFPKSGNTWVARLVAELLQCPVAGFWCEPLRKEIAQEGQARASEYACFKSHHSLEELRQTLRYYGNQTEKVIYVVRDPRAIAVSGSHYFKIPMKYPRTHRILAGLPLGLRVYHSLVDEDAFRMSVMARAICEGSDLSPWLRMPWGAHVQAYSKASADVSASILVVQYEALLQDTCHELRRFASFLGLVVPDERLARTAAAQDFHTRKREFLAQSRTADAHFLRSGKKDAWVHELPEKIKTKIEQTYRQELVEFGYKLGCP